MFTFEWNCDSCEKSGPVPIPEEDKGLTYLQFGSKHGFEGPGKLASEEHAKQEPECNGGRVSYTLAAKK